MNHTKPAIELRDENTPLWSPEELLELHKMGMRDEVKWQVKEVAKRIYKNLIGQVII